MRRMLMLWGAGVALVWAGACSDANPGPPTNLGVTSGGTTAASTGGEGGEGGAPAPCVPDCAAGLECCDGVCANVDTDPTHCGSCLNNCPGPHAVCLNNDCVQAPCTDEELDCPGSDFCCGAVCCAYTNLCCPAGMDFVCTAPNENGGCPI